MYEVFHLVALPRFGQWRKGATNGFSNDKLFLHNDNIAPCYHFLFRAHCSFMRMVEGYTYFFIYLKIRKKSGILEIFTNILFASED